MNDGDESLSRLERTDVDRAAIDERLHERVAASDEDGNADRCRLRHVARFDDDRQRQRRRLESEATGDVRGALHVFDRRLDRHDDAGGHGVGQTVAVGVADCARRDVVERGEAAQFRPLRGDSGRRDAGRKQTKTNQH